MPYGHSSAEKVMWPTPPAEGAETKLGDIDAGADAGGAPPSSRRRSRPLRRALETPAVIEIDADVDADARGRRRPQRPLETPASALVPLMSYGYSSAEKKMWPTVQMKGKRRRVRSPEPSAEKRESVAVRFLRIFFRFGLHGGLAPLFF